MSDSNQPILSLKDSIRSTVVVCGQYKGRLKDILISTTDRKDEATHILVGYGTSTGAQMVRWDDVKSFDEGGMQLADGVIGTTNGSPSANLLHLGNCVLGRRLLDTKNGAIRVARDAKLILSGGKLKVSLIDFAPIPRAGGKFIAYMADFFRWPFTEPLRAEMIPFENVVIPMLELSTDATSTRRKIRAVDLAELLEEMDLAARVVTFNNLEYRAAATVLRHASPLLRAELMRSAGAKHIAMLISLLSPAEAIYILSILPFVEIEMILELIEGPVAAKIYYLLKNRTGEISHFLGCKGLCLPPTTTVSQTIDAYRAMVLRAGAISYIYVIDADGYLVGVVSAKALLQSAADDLLGNIMTESPIRLYQDDSMEKASRLLSRYNLLALPVVNQLGRLVGVILKRDLDSFAMIRR